MFRKAHLGSLHPRGRSTPLFSTCLLGRLVSFMFLEVGLVCLSWSAKQIPTWLRSHPLTHAGHEVLTPTSRCLTPRYLDSFLKAVVLPTPFLLLPDILHPLLTRRSHLTCLAMVNISLYHSFGMLDSHVLHDGKHIFVASLSIWNLIESKSVGSSRKTTFQKDLPILSRTYAPGMHKDLFLKVWYLSSCPSECSWDGSLVYLKNGLSLQDGAPHGFSKRKIGNYFPWVGSESHLIDS